MQRYIALLQRAFPVPFLITLLLLLGQIASSAGKQPLPERRSPVFTGRVQFVSNPPKEYIAFSYAVLYIDGTGRCISNALPLRFDIDTTELTNGKHVFKVVLFNDAGILYEMPSFTVMVKNPDGQPASDVITPPAASGKKQPAASANAIQQVAVIRNPIQPTILFNSELVAFPVLPFIIEGRTMAMLRPLIALAGGSLQWHGKMGTATVNRRTVTFTLEENTALLDGKPVTLARPVTMVKNRVFAPVTLWRDVLSGVVTYEHKTRSIWLGKLTAPTSQQDGQHP